MADYMTPKVPNQQQLDVETLKEHADKQREPKNWPKDQIERVEAEQDEQVAEQEELTRPHGPLAWCQTEECGWALGRKTREVVVVERLDQHLIANPSHVAQTDRPIGYYQDRRDEYQKAHRVDPGDSEDEIPPNPWTPWDGDTAEGEPRGQNPLEQWWRENTENEITWLVPKAEEYGGMHRASDLVDLGRTMVQLMGRDPDIMSEDRLQIMGIYFYIEGKLGRWKAAILEGREVSSDTLTDISVYARMALRARQAGGWPV